MVPRLITPSKGTQMSMFESRRDLSDESDFARHASSMANDAMLRAIGVLVLLGIGAMHFLQIVATFQGTPLLAGAYLVLIAACILVAGGLVTRGDSRTWAAAGIVSAGAIGGYVMTRLANTPLDNQDLGNWSCMLGLAALFVETSLLAFSGYALVTKRTRRGALVPGSVTLEAARGRTAA
jgi:hypothetical protein